MSEEQNTTLEEKGQPSEAEQRAKAQGWVPQAEYRGNPDNWRSAEDFLAVGDKIHAVQAERNEKMAQDLTDMKRQMQAFTEHHVKVVAEAKKEAYNKAITDLKAKQREAAEDGDMAEFDRVTQEIEAKKPPKTESQDTNRENAQPDPEFIQWSAENQWYSSNPEMMDTANALGATIPTHITGRAFYDEVTKKIKALYPDKFANLNRNQPNNVEGNASAGGQSSGKKKGKTIASLPPEARKIAEDFVSQGLFKSVDDYAKAVIDEYGDDI